MLSTLDLARGPAAMGRPRHRRRIHVPGPVPQQYPDVLDLARGGVDVFVVAGAGGAKPLYRASRSLHRGDRASLRGHHPENRARTRCIAAADRESHGKGYNLLGPYHHLGSGQAAHRSEPAPGLRLWSVLGWGGSEFAFIRVSENHVPVSDRVA